jgi:hypothetical protein
VDDALVKDDLEVDGDIYGEGNLTVSGTFSNGSGQFDYMQAKCYLDMAGSSEVVMLSMFLDVGNGTETEYSGKGQTVTYVNLGAADQITDHLTQVLKYDTDGEYAYIADTDNLSLVQMTGTVGTVSAIDTATDELTIVGHGLTRNEQVVFDSTGCGITAGTIYGVKNVNGDKIQLCTNLNGGCTAAGLVDLIATGCTPTAKKGKDENFTIAFWTKFTDATDASQNWYNKESDSPDWDEWKILPVYDSNNFYVMFHFMDMNAWSGAANVYAASTVRGSTLLYQDIWYFIVASYDNSLGSGATVGNGMSMWVDGVPQTETVTNDANYKAMENSPATFNIGKDPADNTLRGYMGQGIIFRGTVTDADVWKAYMCSRGYYGK